MNAQSWYTYDSGNLLSLFPGEPERQIRSIVGVWFYASGHEYDVQVSEVSLLAQQKPATPAGVIEPEETATEAVSP